MGRTDPMESHGRMTVRLLFHNAHLCSKPQVRLETGIVASSCGANWRTPRAVACLLLLLALLCPPSDAIPAFARKYNLPCSACHEAWPKLNNFGIVFRDNGFQIGNERDAPVYQHPSYFPVSFRVTPQWHRESDDHVAVDNV